jgi:hypothetical protein
MTQNLARGFTPSFAAPDRPLTLVELLPQMSLERGMTGSSMRYRTASHESVRGNASTRDYLLSVIDSALALVDFDENEARQAGPAAASTDGIEPQ